MPQVVVYRTTDGNEPFSKWLAGLKGPARAKVVAAVERMLDGNFGTSRSVGEGVLERKINFGPGYRIYYGRDGDELVILLAGGTKKRQQADIEYAKTLWTRYKQGNLNDRAMANTRDFQELVKEMAARDPEFRSALLTEVADAFLNDEVRLATRMLRNLVEATLGFEQLGEELSKSPDSLERTLRAGTGSRAEDLFAILKHLQVLEGVSLTTHAVKTAVRPARSGVGRAGKRPPAGTPSLNPQP